MLGNRDVIATVAVKDLGTARPFYEDKLGLKPLQVEESHGVITYETGGSSLLVYASQFAGTNQATTVTWSVGGDIARRDTNPYGRAFPRRWISSPIT